MSPTFRLDVDLTQQKSAALSKPWPLVGQLPIGLEAQADGREIRTFEPSQQQIGVVDRSVGGDVVAAVLPCLDLRVGLRLDTKRLEGGPLDRPRWSLHRRALLQPLALLLLPLRPAPFRRRRRDRHGSGRAQDLAGLDKNRRAKIVVVDSRVEEGVHLVVLTMRDRIVLMCMALGTPYGEAEPDRAGRVDPVHDLLDPCLFRVDAPFLIDDGLAMETRRDQLRLGRAWIRRSGQEIPGELLDGEAIEWLVVVDRLDDPVAIRPHLPLAIDRIAMSIGIPCLVEPMAPPALPVMGGGEQPIDQLAIELLLLGDRPGLESRDKSRHLLRARQQPGQIEREPSDQGRRVRLRRRCDPLRLQAGQDERVDLVPHPARLTNRRRGGPGERLKGPVALITCPLGDPAAEQLGLGGGDRGALRGRGRHHLRRLVGGDPSQQFTLLRSARRNDPVATTILCRPLERVEAQSGLAILLVRPVAGEAPIREDGSDVTIEADLGSGLARLDSLIHSVPAPGHKSPPDQANDDR